MSAAAVMTEKPNEFRRCHIKYTFVSRYEGLHDHPVYQRSVQHHSPVSEPISMRFGEKKLLEICRSTLEREPRVNELFLFYNGKRNILKLFWLDGTGSQELSKELSRGGFLLPAPKGVDTFVKLERAKLDSLFRS